MAPPDKDQRRRTYSFADDFADDSMHRLNRLWEHFPWGLAPYGRTTLLTFAVICGIVALNRSAFIGVFDVLYGLFPGGIMAVGILGAVNLRRAGRAQGAGLLFVVSLLFALLAASVGHLVVADPQSPGFAAGREPQQMEALFVFLLIGVVYALIIAFLQRPIRQHWNALSEKKGPSLADLGGFQSMLGWLIVILLVNVVLFSMFSGFIAPQLTAVAVISP